MPNLAPQNQVNRLIENDMHNSQRIIISTQKKEQTGQTVMRQQGIAITKNVVKRREHSQNQIQKGCKQPERLSYK